jgi:hypothetical protein
MMEMVCSIVVQAVGALIFATVIGEVSSAFVVRKTKEDVVRKRLLDMLDYVASGARPDTFRGAVAFRTETELVDCISDGSWAVGSLYDENELLGALPVHIRTAIVNQGYARLREGAHRIPLFATVSRSTFATLLAQMGNEVRLANYRAGSTIVERGEHDTSLYIILGASHARFSSYY